MKNSNKQNNLIKETIINKVIDFIKYHNGFTIGLALVFVFSGAIFASEDLRNAVVGEGIVTQAGIDNSVLLNADLENFDSRMQITDVQEDNRNYYVNYSYRTLAIQGNIWAEIVRGETLTVSKNALAGRDLGLYLIEELGEVADSKLAYLQEVQDMEKEKGQTQIVETVEYTGLIGLVLDVKNKILPGYEAVVKPEQPGLAAVGTIEEVAPPATSEVAPPAGGATSATSPELPPDAPQDAPPDTIIDAHPNATTTATEATFVFHANKPNCVFTCQLDYEMWQGCESPKTYTDLSTGSHIFSVQAIDAGNREDPGPAIFEWQILAENPIVQEIIATTTQETATTTI